MSGAKQNAAPGGAGERFVIVGGGHAACTLANLLRRSGWQGETLLISDEACAPYHRPPLSKQYMTEQLDDGQMAQRSAEDYEKNGVELVLDTRVCAIDRAKQQLQLRLADDSERTIGYDQLALCTGARPRPLDIPGARLDGVFYLRSLADAAAIRKAASQAKRAVIVGGGYIGLELAASLRTLGLEVTVLEAMDRLLQRVTSPELSAFFARLHTAEGVSIRTGAQVREFTGVERVSGVACDGEQIPADLVIVGIGVVPNTELAEQAGLAVDNGMIVDEQCRTRDERIWALGDCCSFPSRHYRQMLRLESIPNATSHARRVAALVGGQKPPPEELPWFWSDQYYIKLQIAGVQRNYDQLVLRGDDFGHSFSAWYLADGVPIAADCINCPQDFAAARRLIAQGVSILPDVLADPKTNLKEFAAGK